MKDLQKYRIANGSTADMHGLRHVYTSKLASFGKLDMYVLQKFMTHKSPKMTQRYAHLRDETLKNGAGQIDDIFKAQRDKKRSYNRG